MTRKVQIRDGSGAAQEFTLGEAADLDAEDIRDSRGRRVTEAYVRAAVAEAQEHVGRGRPSLSGSSASPQVTFRLSAQLRERMERRAASEGKRVSEIAREALERYV